MADDFALDTQVGPLAIWQWVMGAGALGLIVYKLLHKGASSSTSSTPGQGDTFQSSQSQTSTDQQGNQYTSSYSAQGNGYLPGQLTTQASPMPYSLGDIYVNTNVSPTTSTGDVPQQAPLSLNFPDIRSSNGRDEGQYRFGADEIQYLNSNIGNFGLTQQVVNDVQTKYNQAVQQMGADEANNYHYAWYGPGQVSMVPEFISGGVLAYPQATTQSGTSPGPIDTANSGTGQQQSPPVYPGNSQQAA